MQQGNPDDWSIEGWTAEYRRIGESWWEFRVFNAEGKVQYNTNGSEWFVHESPYTVNLALHIKRTMQHYASVGARATAEIYTFSFDEA
jgi:hypothetical protein